MKHYTLILSLASLFIAVPYQGICGDEPKPMTTIRLAVSKDGKGSLFVSNHPAVKSEQPKPPPSEPVKLKGFGNARVSRLKDGRLKVNYDFSRVRNLNDLIPRGTTTSGFKMTSDWFDDLFMHYRIDPKENALVVVQPPSESRFNYYIFNYPRIFRPPYEIELIGDVGGNNILRVLSDQGQLEVKVIQKKNEQVTIVIVNQEASHKELGEKLALEYKEEGHTVEYRFQINEKLIGEDTVATFFRNTYKRTPFVIRSFQVTAYYPAFFGVDLDQNGSQVVVKKVQKESAADIAGIKKGDILLRVGAKAASDTKTARKLLSECKIGTLVDLEVLRFGKKSTIAVTPR